MRLSKVQTARKITQATFAALLIAGMFFKIRPIIGIMVIAAFIAGNFFCGWLCMFGAVQEYISRAGSLIIRRRLKMPRSIQKYLQFSRYLFMAAVILIVGKNANIIPFNSLRNFMGLISGRETTAIAAAVIAFFLIVSLIFERPFCNYFCPEGIKYALAGLTRIFTIRRDPERCIDCGSCDRVCPMNVRISDHRHVRNAQCINCLRCIESCPAHKALSFNVVNLPKILKEKIQKLIRKK